jgi:squalene cyclase
MSDLFEIKDKLKPYNLDLLKRLNELVDAYRKYQQSYNENSPSEIENAQLIHLNDRVVKSEELLREIYESGIIKDGKLG